MQTPGARSINAENELTAVLARFSTEPEPCRQALRSLRDQDPKEFTLLAVRHLGVDPDGPATPALSVLLIRDALYLHALTDPNILTHKEASEAARVLVARDKRFYVKLSGYAGDSLSAARTTRVLQLIEALGSAGLMVPWLRRMTRHLDGYVRQKAVMIMCQTGSNPMLVERQLQSPDPRVRANAVESLWSVTTPSAHSLLEFATQDTHHRVALNALVGLFMQGDSSAIERMREQARNSSPAFRVAAAWALGLTGRAEAWSALNALRDDPEEVVRESALRAIVKVPEPRRSSDPAAAKSGNGAKTAEEPAKSGLVTPEFRLVS